MRFHHQYPVMDRRLRDDRDKHMDANGSWDCDCTRGTFFKSRPLGLPHARGHLRRWHEAERQERRAWRKRDRREARRESLLEA